MWFDKYVVDLLVNLQGWIVRAGSVVLRSVQTGFVQNYALLMVLGLIAFFAVYLVILIVRPDQMTDKQIRPRSDKSVR